MIIDDLTVSGSDQTVSSNEPYVVVVSDYQDILDSLAVLEDQIAVLAADTVYTQGYLSSSSLDLLDRVVSGGSYDYYVAYRYDSDTYNTRLYLSDDMELDGAGRLYLYDAVLVNSYRVRVGSTGSVYRYYYAFSQAGDVSFSMTDNYFYYTNCVEGYPILGDLRSPSYDWNYVWLFIGLVVIFSVFMLRWSVKRHG